MTVAANVAFGWHFAAWGVLMAGFPAAAFLGNAEATIMFGRQSQSVNTAEFRQFPGPPSDSVAAAEASMRATIAAGNPLSLNQLTERFSLTRAAATKVRTAVLAESNGGHT